MTDEMLRAALEEVDNAILAALPEPSACDHQFSPRFENRMRKVRRRAKHPTAYRVLRQVACILLAILILFSSVMVFSPEARAAVVNWLKEQFETFYHYFYAGESNSDRTERSEYELGWVPDGYVLLDSFSVENSTTIIYVGDTGLLIQFTYTYGSDSNPVFMDGDNYSHYLVNNRYDVYMDQSGGNNNGITWTDQNDSVLYCICAPLGEKELVQLAESVIKK